MRIAPGGRQSSAVGGQVLDGSESRWRRGGIAAAGATTSLSVAGMRLSITPASGSRHVRPGQGITVTAAGGKISAVTVHTAGEPVTGALNAARTQWRSKWALTPSVRYTVTAKAVSDSGQAVTQRSSFRTLRPAATFQTMIFEGYHKTYGVGMPIMLTFSQPITDKAAVERSLQL